MRRAGWGWWVAVLLAACGPTEVPDTTGGPPPSECSPTSCGAQGKNCGSLPDGCGGVLECGTCGDGESCGGGGVANVCGAGPACVPTSCEALGKNCGVVSDGCGGTLECGTCAEGQSCGAAGEPNVCGPDGDGDGDGDVGSAKWLTVTEHRVVDLVARPTGDVVVLHERAPADFALTQYGADGKGGWTSAAISDRDGRSSHPRELNSGTSNRIYVEGHSTNGEAHGEAAILWRFEANGATEGQIARSGNVNSLFESDEASNGVWAYLHSTDLYGAIYFDRGGTETKFGSEDNDPWFFEELAFAPDGNAWVVAWSDVPRQYGDISVGRPGYSSLILLKVSPEGNVLWARDLPRGTRVLELEVSAKGTVVMVVSFEEQLKWGTDTTRGMKGVALLTLEANGAERWLREISANVELATMALDPAGFAAVAVPASCNGTEVHKYSLTGEELWRRKLAPKDCQGFVRGSVEILRTTEVILGGNFEGTVDFGLRMESASNEQGFLLNLGR